MTQFEVVMKALFSCLVLTASILFFSSCQKEINYISTVAPAADSIYLEQVISLDTTIAPADTLDKTVFQYDASKRIKQSLSASGSPGAADTVRHEFFYQGTSNLPFKYVYYVVDNWGGPVYRHSDTIYFQYVNGIVSKDSVLGWNLAIGQNTKAEVREFSISGNIVTKQIRTYQYVSGNYLLAGAGATGYTVTKQADNITNHVLTSGDGYFDQMQCTYDNKPNPLVKAFPVRYPVCESPIINDWNNQMNNPLTVQYKESGSSGTDSELYNYVYRQDNLPSSASFSSSFGFAGYNKLLYIYKRW